VASALCASYVGGSLNFAAVAASLGLAPGPLLAAETDPDGHTTGFQLDYQGRALKQFNADGSKK